MKNMTIRILALLTIFFASSAKAGDFTGSWSIVYPKNDTKKYDDSFDLHLIQNGNKICGLHFGSIRGGAKIDSSFGSEQKSTVSGTVNGNKAKIVIISSQSEVPIAGTILLQGSTLNWQVSSPEKHSTRTIPKSAELHTIPSDYPGYKDIKKLCCK